MVYAPGKFFGEGVSVLEKSVNSGVIQNTELIGV